MKADKKVPIGIIIKNKCSFVNGKKNICSFYLRKNLAGGVKSSEKSGEGLAVPNGDSSVFPPMIVSFFTVVRQICSAIDLL